MEVPNNVTNSDDVLSAKLELLDSLQPLESGRVVLGQYQNYVQQVREELEKPPHFFTKTQTFASKLSLLNPYKRCECFTSYYSWDDPTVAASLINSME